MEGNINDFKSLIYLIVIVVLVLLARPRQKLRLQPMLVIVCLCLFVSVHTIFSHQIAWSINELSKFVFGLVLIAVGIERIGSNLMMKIMALYMWFNCLVLIISSDVIFLLGLSASFSSGGLFRGVLSNSNMFAYAIVLSLPFSSYFLRSKRIRIFIILNSLFLVYLSGSRGALICLLAYCLWFISWYFKTYRWSAFLVLGIFLFLTLDTDFIQKGSGDTEALATRMHFWKARITAISQKPLLGWGYAVNEFTYFDKYTSTNIREKGNTLLALIEEFGFIFGIPIVLLWLRVFYLAYVRLNKSKIYWIAPLLMMVVINSMFETWLFNFNSINTMVLWTIVMIGLNSHNDFVLTSAE